VTGSRPTRAPAPDWPLPRGLSEGDFKASVLGAAEWYGWVVHHGRPARTKNGWRTPIEGLPGFPDLVLARRGRVILAELKTHRRGSEPTEDQRRWLAELGEHGRLWRPDDWPEILRELSSP
jgi:hypothetical protein